MRILKPKEVKHFLLTTWFIQHFLIFINIFTELFDSIIIIRQAQHQQGYNLQLHLHALWCLFANDFIAKQLIPSLNAILTRLQYMPVASLLPGRSPGQVPAPAVLGCLYTACFISTWHKLEAFEEEGALTEELSTPVWCGQDIDPFSWLMWEGWAHCRRSHP